jgi:serine/threonine protein kinase
MPMNPDDYQIVKKIITTVIQLPVDQQQTRIDESIQKYPHLENEIKDIKNLLECSHNEVLETPAMVSQSSEFIAQQIEANTPMPDYINHYQVLDKIGSGGMGNVYLAKQEYPADRLVAIKILKGVNDQQQLIAETQILAQLNHPNIATFFEIDQTKDQCFFIVMEYIEGDDIISCCDENNYTLKQKIALFQQLCEGISFAHQKGIIHCDIKPSNVRLTKINDKPTVKVIDFGISQFENDTDSIESTSGTPAYLSPELLDNNKSGAVDTSRDIYALGVLLHKLLTGKMPSPSGDGIKSIAPDLIAIINKAMAFEKSDRYLTPISINEDLNRFLDKQVVLARDSNVWYVSQRFVQRRFGVVLFSSALLIALIGGYWAQSNQAKIATQQAQLALTAQIKAQASEQRAISSLEESQRLTQFLTDLFNLSNPEKQISDTITVESLINKASDKLLAIEHPTLADAGFMHTISDIYTRMDKLDKAQILSETALKLKQSSLMESDPVVIGEIIQLGLIHRKQGNSDESEKFLVQAIKLLNINHPLDKSQLAFVHNHLGNLYWQTQYKDKSIEQHELAIKLRKDTGESRLLADSYNNIAVIYKRYQQWSLADKYTQMALILYQQEYGDRHPYIALIKHNISAYLVHQNKWDEAEKLLLEALSIFTEVYGPNHNNTLNTHFNLAQNYDKRMQFDQAINTWNIIIDSYKNQNKAEKEAKFRSYLGLTLTKAKRYEDAIEQHQLSLLLSNDIVPKQKNFKAKLLSRYARALIASKSFDTAKISLTQAIELIEKDHGKMNYERLFVLNILADVYYQQKNNDKALENYQEVLTNNDKNDNLNQKQQIKALLGIGIIRLDTQQYTDAEENLQKALKINQSITSEVNHTTSLILFQMAKLQEALDNTNQAQSLLKQALEIQSKILPYEHPDLILTRAEIER